MFEISVASKYLIPRRRQLSVSIISLISVLVIALVVWLIVVFFSVTDGLEKNWVDKLTALTAPVRITPTKAYYHSYYYLIDGISDASNYSNKTIREKLNSGSGDPYNPEIDEEIPAYWAIPDLNPDGTLKDIVKLAYASVNEISEVKDLSPRDYELTGTHIQLRLLRNAPILPGSHTAYGKTQSIVSYPAYLGNFESDNPHLTKTLLPVEKQDLNNVLHLIGIAVDDFSNEFQDENIQIPPQVLQKRLADFFEHVRIRELKTRPAGWNIPATLLPSHADWEVCAIFSQTHGVKLYIPQQKEQLTTLQKSLEEQGFTVLPGRVLIDDGKLTFLLKNQPSETLSRYSLILAGESLFNAELNINSAHEARQLDDLRFMVEIPIQGRVLKGNIPFRGLEIANAQITPPTGDAFPFWIYPFHAKDGAPAFQLPGDAELGNGIALPKSFRDAGVLIGDRGTLSYLSPTTSTLQEHQIPVYVAGFYDPGIIPIGGKFILANQEVASLIRASHNNDDHSDLTNGINVRFSNLHQADLVKSRIEKAFKEKGINRYWNVETYREYEFTKNIMDELQNQKNLFMLIAVVIILVACSNIISMLVILVNDKRIEIGILRSMGASSKSIALIFGLSGAAIGILGSVAGICAALFTLHHLDTLVSWLSKMQGREMFSANFYGQMLPSELSFEALSFVLIATVCMSLLAGIVPAVKACLLRPSEILRSGGG